MAGASWLQSLRPAGRLAELESLNEIAHETKHIMKKTVALILATSTSFLAGCCTTHHVTKWEYKQLNSVVPDGTLNQLGDQGWNVVGYSGSPGEANGFYILKRPKQ